MEPRGWVIASPEAMQSAGAALGQTLRGGETILLDGPLGAGKTQFIKGLGEGLGVQTVVNSPTFNIVKSHRGRLALHHIDLYRLDSEPEIADLGLEDLQGQEAVLAIEWAERYPALRGDRWHQITLAMGDSVMERRMTWHARHPVEVALLAAFERLEGVAPA